MEPRINERFDPFIRMVLDLTKIIPSRLSRGTNQIVIWQKGKENGQIIHHTLATAFVSIVVLPLPPVLAQTQQQLNWCLHKDDAFSPDLQIDGCTAAIKSGHQFGKNLSRIFYNRGIAHAKKSQYDHAIADFNQAIRLDPDSIFALNNRGAAHARNGQYDDAIADFNEAIRIDASYAITYNNRGIAYAKKGQFDRAVEDFDQAIRFDPKDASAFKNRDLTRQLMSGTVTSTEVASTPKTRVLTEQMKELPPSANAIDASVPIINPLLESAKEIPPKVETDEQMKSVHFHHAAPRHNSMA
jgi:tetratricopeptide (TPR) repeat protein